MRFTLTYQHTTFYKYTNLDSCCEKYSLIGLLPCVMYVTADSQFNELEPCRYLIANFSVHQTMSMARVGRPSRRLT